MTQPFELFQDVVLNQLIKNQQYLDLSLPFIQTDYFEDSTRGEIYNQIKEYVDTYLVVPTEPALLINLQNSGKLSGDGYISAKTYINKLFTAPDTEYSLEWLKDKTEHWCRKRAFYNAMVEGSLLLDKKQEDFYGTDLPEKMEEALAISFDIKVGMDFLEDYDRKYEFMHEDSERVAFDIDYLNKITKNGLPKKSLTCLMSTTTGGFKTGSMCHFTSSWIANGINVLYITNEMSEEMISQRIDANLMDVELDYLEQMPYALYKQKSDEMQKKCAGKLIIKEYPNGTAHAGHFRFLLKELKQKKGFVPDVICVDYLNICASSRLPPSALSNSFTYVKAIAEELRALAVEHNVAMITATQGNRDAVDGTDISIANVSECIFVEELIQLVDGTRKPIGNAQIGDLIESHDGTRKIIQVHPRKMKDCVKIRLKSGKEIIVSKNHKFPTPSGRGSVNSGDVKVGVKLMAK